jgi:mannose-6-phosphate isomerase-like protein (cupin superfamily)
VKEYRSGRWVDDSQSSSGPQKPKSALHWWKPWPFRSTEPPLHIHHHEDEAWYILNGKMPFYVGDQSLEATAGCFVFGPRGIPHIFTVDVEPTRVLVFASPAGFEHFALELGTPAAADDRPPELALPTHEVLGPVAERYGIEVVGPPHRAP